MKKEIELLREIADEAKALWDKGGLPLKAVKLINLLTDRINMDNRQHSQSETVHCDTATGAHTDDRQFLVR